MIEITVDDREVRRMLKNLAGRLKDMRPVMKNIAGIMHNAVEENFEQEGRPKWEPSKRAQRQGGKTLQDKGQLAASISQKYAKDSAMVSTNKKYAAAMQFGLPARTIKAKNKPYLKFKIGDKWIQKKEVRAGAIPARPFLKLTDGDLEEIKDAVRGYLKQR